MNSSSLLSALQTYLQRRKIEVETLTTDAVVAVMFDWFRLGPADPLDAPPAADVLLFRHGGWSEGCATGFKLSLLRRITERDANGAATDWVAGITLMFEPAGYGDLAPLSTASSDWPSLDAFLRAIESSAAYKRTMNVTPMGVLLESGGLR